MGVAVTIAPSPILQFFSNNGQLAVGGSILTQVGGVNYPTYQDSGGNTPLPNPIPLNSRGEISNAAGASAQLFLAQNVTYTFTLYDANGNLLNNPQSVTAVGPPTQTSVAAVLYPQTQTEQTLSIIPSGPYPEGDIRRYGASIAIPDNSAAIGTALLVSAAGGSAAYIPPGNWPYLSSPSTGNGSYGASSMYGAGRCSVLAPVVGVDGLTFVPDPQGGAESSRFFRDFMIIGPSSTTSTNNGITHNLASGRNAGVQFSNITIQNFQNAVYVNGANGLWQSAFNDCFFYNNYNGYYLNGQVSILNIRGGEVQRSTITGSGIRYGLYTNNVGGGNVQSLHIFGTQFYNYDVGIALNLTLFTTLTDCDISSYNITGIALNGVQGGTFVKGCWAQANTAVAAAVTGIQINDNSAALPDKVSIDGNNLLGNGYAGSLGIYCGTFYQGLSILNNTIGSATAPFATGVSGVGPGANSANMVCRYNTIYALGTAIQLYVNCTYATIGPNVIQNGTPLGLTGGSPAGLNYIYESTPMTGGLTFAASTAQSVTFATNLPLAGYTISISPVSTTAPPAWWISAVGVGGFTVNFASAFTGSVYWSIRVG